MAKRKRKRKPRDLNTTWSECLRLWRAIRRIARNQTMPIDVEAIKEIWMVENGYKGIESNCFFCEYAKQKCDNCLFCPGRKVDPKFSCCVDEGKCFYKNPIEFCNWLEQLNRKRLKNGKK